ncbi:MalY/PatB family protein [Bacillus spongiae]|uniref:cysteine-S-conjugate beta-lyase n=1 Tax=Bacillus spongiae TaxID=2683610 RepID=A0ABU8HF32_9BACI
MENFDRIINRKATASVKWDMAESIFGERDLLPLWVADMDFEAPLPVKEALNKRVQHGIYGYSYPTTEVKSSITNWFKSRHSWSFSQDAILYSPGVVPSIATAIQSLTEKGDRILIQTPVYYPFFQLIQENDRKVVDCPLVIQNDQYHIDFDAFEECLKQGVKLFLFCSPHNPVGRVWTNEEQTKIADLCKAYNVIIISDEIHCDLVYSPHTHIPIAKANQDHVITLTAPSKTFNIAGLQSALMIIENQQLRVKIENSQKKQGFFTVNALGLVAMEAAYRDGAQWVDELLAYLEKNKKFVSSYLVQHLPNVKMIDAQGTFLLWLDFRETGFHEEEVNKRLLSKGKIALERGSKYGDAGAGFFRLNIGCSRDQLETAMHKMKQALQ